MLFVQKHKNMYEILILVGLALNKIKESWKFWIIFAEIKFFYNNKNFSA